MPREETENKNKTKKIIIIKLIQSTRREKKIYTKIKQTMNESKSILSVNYIE